MSVKNRVKIASIALTVAGIASILLSDNPVVDTAYMSSQIPTSMRTGAPGQLTCATTECHLGEINTGPGQFVIEAPSVYEPGKTYQITVRHKTTDSTRTRWGFELTALSDDNRNVGALRSRDDLTATTETIVDFGQQDIIREQMSHNNNSTFPGQVGEASWSFDWIAPGKSFGAVTFYAAGVQANNDGAPTGDQTYTAKFTIEAPKTATPPRILAVAVSGKALRLEGVNFDDDAELLINGERHKKTTISDLPPSVIMIAKKAAKKIARGETVILQVKNEDGSLSEAFTYTRPL